MGKSKEDSVTCAIANFIGTESGCVNAVKFSNSRVNALAEVSNVNGGGILAGFRDGTLILISKQQQILQVFSGTDCKEIISIAVEKDGDFMCLSDDGCLRHYSVNSTFTQESSVQS